MIFLDLNMKGSQHLLINAGFIEEFRSLKHINIIFGDRAHLTELSKMLKKTDNQQYFALPVFRSGNFYKSIFKTVVEVFIYFFIFIYASIVQDHIFILSSYASSKIFIEFFSRILPVKVFLVHHGELTGIVTNESRYAKFVKLYFALRQTGKLIDVFLSKGIKKNATMLLRNDMPYSIHFLHPYPKSFVYPLKKIDTTRKPQIGYFGSLNRQNRNRMQEIISALSKRILLQGYQDFELKILCPNPSSFDFGNIVEFIVVDTSRFIPNDDYVEQIKDMDIVLLPYEESQYDLMASGILADCAIHNINFWVAKSTFFVDWIEERGGGVMFDSFDQLLKAISDSNVVIKRLTND